MMTDELVAAIDVGTQAARCLVVDTAGAVTASAAAPIRSPASDLPEGWAEQDAEAWWQAACAACRAAVEALGDDSARIRRVAVDSTSGTIVPVDRRGAPLRPALMYNDVRAEEEARLVQEAGEEVADRLGYSFQASFALPKIVWVRNHEPEVAAGTVRFLHAADFIVARLAGGLAVSDSSNALKTGYDLVAREWPAFIADDLGLAPSLLPEVVTPGEPIGRISAEAAEQTLLPEGALLVAGCTDGTAAFLASGASRPGDVNSNLGTTLVVRAVSERLVRGPGGGVYSHLHPEGWWLPGGASSSGGEIILKTFGDRAAALEELVPEAIPTELLCYPLARTGERLPLVDAHARGFLVGRPSSDAEHLAAMMEGVAFVERWLFEVLEDLGAGRAERVFVTGGAARSETWLRIRASALGLTLERPAVAESAFGAAILAASGPLGGVAAATRAMVRPDSAVGPDPDLRQAYAVQYARFREECARRGYGAKRA
jgi:xylulokinase